MANPTQNTTGAKPGSERARDEQRRDAGPQHHGESWKDADAHEEVPPTSSEPTQVTAADNGEVESGGQHAGMGRGEKPRKLKSQEK